MSFTIKTVNTVKALIESCGRVTNDVSISGILTGMRDCLLNQQPGIFHSIYRVLVDQGFFKASLIPVIDVPPLEVCMLDPIMIKTSHPSILLLKSLGISNIEYINIMVSRGFEDEEREESSSFDTIKNVPSTIILMFKGRTTGFIYPVVLVLKEDVYISYTVPIEMSNIVSQIYSECTKYRFLIERSDSEKRLDSDEENEDDSEGEDSKEK